MAIEIERKFLVVSDAWRATAAPGVRYRQGYLSTDPRCSVRIRTSADSAWLNIKGDAQGIRRLEFEYEVPAGDAHEMLESLCVKPVIEKTRYVVRHQGRDWEIDVFEGENAGLVVAEIELAATDERFARPEWVGDEVSGDARYLNQRLVDHPYSRWGR